SPEPPSRSIRLSTPSSSPSGAPPWASPDTRIRLVRTPASVPCVIVDDIILSFAVPPECSLRLVEPSEILRVDFAFRAMILPATTRGRIDGAGRTGTPRGDVSLRLEHIGCSG